MKQAIIAAVAGGLLLSGCADPQQGQTVGEGAFLGGLGGALIGGLAGGGLKGAIIGGLAGVAAGALAGDYVAQEKRKYTTIDQRIDGERALAAQAIQTAQAQTAASEASRQDVESQLGALEGQRSDQEAAQAHAHALLATLEQQRTTLVTSQAALKKRLAGEQDFIHETETEVGSDTSKAQQLAAWKNDVPAMQAAVDSMTNEVAALVTAEARVRDAAGASS